MIRALAIGCVSLLAFTAAPATGADAAPPKNSPARCAQFAKLVTDRQTFKDGQVSVDRYYDPEAVYKVLKACPSQAKLASALFIPLEFLGDYQGKDREGGQVWKPGITDAEIAQSMSKSRRYVQNIIDGYKQKAKDGVVDEQLLKASMRYLIWSWNDDECFSYCTLELLARMYPEDYAGVKPLAQEKNDEYENWEEIANDWLPNGPPAKH